MKVSSFLLLFILTVLPSSAHAKRILFASQFSLIPESAAHLTFGKDSQAALDPKSIKVLIWNLKKGQQKGLDRDLPEYGKDRDLLMLSEGYLSPAVKGIFDSFDGIHWDMGVSFLYKKDHNYETGTLIGSRVAPTWVKVRHTVDFEPFIHTPKALTFARIPIQGSTKELLAISIHAINMVVPAAFKREIEMAKEEIIKHDGPVIFAGDFNTNLKTKVKYLMKTLGNLGMQSVEFRNDDRNRVFGNPIDYTFIRGLHTKDSEVLGKLNSSDHKAMLVELAVD